MGLDRGLYASVSVCLVLSRIGSCSAIYQGFYLRQLLVNPDIEVSTFMYLFCWILYWSSRNMSDLAFTIFFQMSLLIRVPDTLVLSSSQQICRDDSGFLEYNRTFFFIQTIVLLYIALLQKRVGASNAEVTISPSQLCCVCPAFVPHMHKVKLDEFWLFYFFGSRDWL